MKDFPKVSIIIPTYNVEDYLRECLESVINQTLQEIEIICVNDGSTDNSLEILSEYASKDGRIKIINQENMGLPIARNVGIASAGGIYVYLLDSDDYIELDAMENLFAESVKNDLDILYFDGKPFHEYEISKSKFSIYVDYYDRKFDYFGVTDGKTLYIKMHSANAYLPSVCFQFFNRKYILENGLSFFEGIIHEDNLFSFLSILNARRVKYINKSYFHRRIRHDSIMTKDKKAENVRGYLICLYHMLQFVMNQSLDEKTSNTINNHLESIYNMVINIYHSLSLKEKKRFQKAASNSENIFFDIFFLRAEKNKNHSKEVDATSSKIKNELSTIRGSFSFRIGRVFTWIPRKLRDAIRAYRKQC